jgi:type I restriction enzyme M protein
VDQQRILAAKLGPDSDEATVLEAFGSLSGDSLIASTLNNEPVLRSLIETKGTGYSSQWWINLHNAVRRSKRLVESAGEEIPGDTLRRAFATWTGHASRLLELLDLPEGMERYALLQTWEKLARRDLTESQTQLEDEESLAPGVLRIRALSEALLGAASAELERLAASASLVIVPEDSDIWAGPSAEVTIVLQNHGIAPLLRLQVETTLGTPELRLPLLSGGASKNWTLPLGDAPPGSINIGIRWTGEDLTGTALGGSLDLSIDLKEHESRPAIDTFKANPYIVGSPIDDDRNFYGRTDVLDQIERSLRQSGPSTVILLEGNRRVGKTSILKQLRTRVPGWLPVYCQFQGMSGAPSDRNVYRLIAKELLQAVPSASLTAVPDELVGLTAVSTPDRRRCVQGLIASIEDEEPFGRFEELVQLVIQAVRPNRILLMLDEFEKIHEGIEQKQIAPEIPETFRYLFHTYPEVSGILSGSRRIKRLRQEYWNVLFGIGKPIWVRSLDRLSSRKLVSEPVAGRIAYSDAAIDHVLDLCACQPFLLQSLASTIFEICAVTRQASVTVATVEEACLSLVLDNEHFYTIFKQEALTERRRFLACLVDRLSDGPDRVTFQLIRDQLEDTGVEYRSEVRVKEDLEELQELELLSESTDDSYRIEVPLFSRWLRTRVNFDAQLSAALEEEAS